MKKFISSLKCTNLRASLLNIFETNCIEIVEDAHGNYAVQYLLDNLGPELCKNVIEIILHNTVSLSSQKFSSNVVEKCVGLVDRKEEKVTFINIFIIIYQEIF